MRIGRSLQIGLLVMVVMGVAQSAQAASVLRLSLGSLAPLLVVDNGAGDNDLTVGLIDFGGSFNGWEVYVTGIASPLTGGASMMLTGNVMNTAVSADRLVVELSDNNFSGGPGLFTLAYGGSLLNFDVNSLDTSAFTYKSFDNAQFGPVSLGLTTPQFAGAGGLSPTTPFSGTFMTTHGTIPSYAMTIGADFGTSEAYTLTTFSVDASNITVPEPVSLTLLGVGLLGVAAFARRRLQ
jgi:hypothetical protein